MQSKNQPLIQEKSLQKQGWQRELAQAYREPKELLDDLELDSAGIDFSKDAHQQFKLLAPKSYVDKIKKGDWHDPLLRQILPIDDELKQIEGFGFDPVNDQQAMVSDGLLHKYQGRVLLVTTGVCAIHCRYCFRRHFPYSDANPAKDDWNDAIQYIQDNNDLSEVILSGGDPLVLSDHRLQSLCEQLSKIPHVKRLRIHSRLPIVLPERIDNRFCEWFKNIDLQKILVIHANHAQELGEDVAKVLARLKSLNTLLLNQSVLLKGVNDSINALSNLNERLIEQGVLPYYLNVLDRVQGSAHFEVALKKAQQLTKQLRDSQPGYMVPRLVQDVSDTASKQLVE